MATPTVKKQAKEMNCYMSPWTKWLNQWRLRRIIKALTEQVDRGTSPLVCDFAKSLEATEIMSRGMKKGEVATVQITRAQLDSFIRYMCDLHDSKLSRIMLARIGLATLMTRNEKTLGQPAKDVIRDEMIRASKPKSEVISNASKQLRLKL